jgi:hypothetical protein
MEEYWNKFDDGIQPDGEVDTIKYIFVDVIFFKKKEKTIRKFVVYTGKYNKLENLLN